MSSCDRKVVASSIVVFLAALAAARVVAAQQDNTLGFCGDCFCIPSMAAADNNTRTACPYELEPQMKFTDILPIVRELAWRNPVTLDCDPYLSNNNALSSCQLAPPISMEDGGACTLDMESSFDLTICPTNWSYTLRTYPGTLEEAQAEGLRVTHAGNCGACSSLQDLSIYMTIGTQLRQEATACGIRGRVNGDADGRLCYRELGFTDACANIWQYNSANTNRECIQSCAALFVGDFPTNGPPPQCLLDECLVCDEEFSGPIFQRYAGRTRRNSGLLSGIARSCEELILLPQTDPCLPVVTPTEAPTGAPVSTSSAGAMALSGSSWTMVVLLLSLAWEGLGD
jgi:hypothetical protein